MNSERAFLELTEKIKSIIPKHYKNRELFINDIQKIEAEALSGSNVRDTMWLRLLSTSMRYLQTLR